ncbi:MATE family efflux transporter [Companilactobacillus paralimentarius]|uniref:Putative multidrug resistance protein YpnP n=2 Tax=Companilactobacillus bobalius TaxID=2801451 RepID=A0A202F880_9LACO|nr:MATE family efflux transporter [Companilactobacillus bobalius]KAE9563964.1 MATE family efflux transporter [Companilactobacillus bobalius]OVE96689.1 putative multidrug resistance protein YpnP [Companilactobacillus bobalius]GEO58953.1 MATE family efflux transporter [Companilactobacillus paralimentarius]
MIDLTNGRPIKVIFLYTIPLLLGNFFQQFYSFIDTLIVGKTISVNALASVGATGGLTALVIGFAQGMTSGLTILTARKYGANDEAGVRQSFASGIIISLFIIVVFTTIALLVAYPLLVAMQTPKVLLHDSFIFLEIIFAGIFSFVGFDFLGNTMRALGDSRVPLFFLIVSTVLNILLELVFILYLKMGVAGAGLATVVAQTITFVILYFYIRKHIPYLILTRDDFKIDMDEIKELLKISLPMGFQSSIIAIGSIILQFMLNTLGANAVAAYTVAGRVEQIATLPAFSFGLALVNFTAQNMGAKKFDRILKGVKDGILVSVISSLVIGIFLIFFGQSISHLFMNGSETKVLNLIQIYYYFNGSTYFILSILFIVRYTLQGLGNQKAPTIAGIAELLMRVFAGVVLIRIFGFYGAAMANPLAWTGSVLVLVSTWNIEIKKLKNMKNLLNHEETASE